MIEVYITRVGRFCIGGEYPDYLCSELEGITNNAVADEKKTAYSLLNYALERSFGIVNGVRSLKRSPSGKPISSLFFCSLSHSRGFVAVAVSDEEVGIDIEVLSDRNRESLAERILDGNEKERYLSLDGEERRLYFLKCWTKREAVYKMTDRAQPFSPKEGVPESVFIETKRIEVDGETIVLTVSAPTETELKLHACGSYIIMGDR